MSQHVISQGTRKYVFGWDQHLMSFFLQVHVETCSEEENPVVWLGGPDSRMYEVEDLVREARKNDLHISDLAQRQLFKEKDEGV